jgi:hypothetical protein
MYHTGLNKSQATFREDLLMKQQSRATGTTR